jgi:hypothetical protein
MLCISNVKSVLSRVLQVPVTLLPLVPVTLLAVTLLPPVWVRLLSLCLLLILC